jgi:hypothetical protein
MPSEIARVREVISVTDLRHLYADTPKILSQMAKLISY